MTLKKIGLDPQGYETKTSSRSINTVFQNNTGVALLISIIGEEGVSESIYSIRVGEQSSNLTEVARIEIAIGGDNFTQNFTLTAIIPAGSFYKFDVTDGGLRRWSEQELK
jgi:hypothetical protein